MIFYFGNRQISAFFASPCKGVSPDQTDSRLRGHLGFGASRGLCCGVDNALQNLAILLQGTSSLISAHAIPFA